MRHNCPSCLPALLIAGVMTALAGCSGDTAGTAPSVNSSSYFSLALNQHAINMSISGTVSNTIQLSATALNASGDPIPGTGQATYLAADSSVTVTSTGLVTAHYPTNGTRVTVTLSLGNATFADTAFIRVTQNPPTAPINPDSFSIQPAVGDSAVRALSQFGATYDPLVYAKDVAGNLMPFRTITFDDANIVWFSQSNPMTVAVRRVGLDPAVDFFNTFALLDTGHVTLYATAWVYGVPVRDSLKFLVGWPLAIFTSADALAQKLLIGTGGAVTFAHGSSDSVGVVFDDSMVVDSAPDFLFHLYSGSGNVDWAATPPGGFAPFPPFKARSFPSAGTYHYHSRWDPTQTGTVYVLNNPVP